jgi:hypothetical protein
LLRPQTIRLGYHPRAQRFVRRALYGYRATGGNDPRLTGTGKSLSYRLAGLCIGLTGDCTGIHDDDPRFITRSP